MMMRQPDPWWVYIVLPLKLYVLAPIARAIRWLWRHIR